MTTLVLGPSLGTTAAALWGPCAAVLAGLDGMDELRVVTWDLPGHGSAPAARPGLRIAHIAASVLARVPGPFHYAGDSVGGAVGLQLLLDAPDRVLSATLVCTGARLGSPALWEDRIATVRARGTEGLAESAADRWFAPGFPDREPTRSGELLDVLRDVDDEGYAAVCGALAAFDVRDRLGEITSPVLAVAGSDDVVTPPSGLAEIADGVARGRLVVLDGVAHLAPAEAPDRVAALLRDHVLTTDTNDREHQ